MQLILGTTHAVPQFWRPCFFPCGWQDAILKPYNVESRLMRGCAPAVTSIFQPLINDQEFPSDEAPLKNQGKDSCHAAILPSIYTSSAVSQDTFTMTSDGDLSLPLGLALGSPIFPSGCEGKLGSCLENPRDRGAWWAAIYGVAQSQT